MIIFCKNFKRLSIFISKKMNSNSLCTVAVCQFTASRSKDANLIIVKRLIDEARKNNANMIFLPEATDFITSDKSEAHRLAESLEGQLVSEYKTVAKKYNVWLSVGGFHEKIGENKMYNTHILIDNTGNIKSVYRKIHLFDVSIPEKNINLKESKSCTPGFEIVPPVETPAGMLALSVCYDVRFPEISLIQRKMGAHILTYPSAFTTSTGAAHWEILLRARAIENQCYVIAAAQYGQHNEKRTSYGQSMIIDPWGEIISQCPKYNEMFPTDESVAVAEIDLETINRIQQEMPVQSHRRHDIYNLSLLANTVETWNDGKPYHFADKLIPSSTVFYQSQYCFAFTNIRCVVPGHVLVSTLRRVPRLVDLNQEEIADLFQTVIKIQKAMELEHNAESSTICVQDGKYAGQTIPQVHVHILPRKQNDFNRNDDIYLELAKHDSDGAQLFRSSEEMSKEAEKLRTYFSI
ncbi:nitrilase and fragile histidine triad fusion protein NitFhit [Diorhabda carinulata]|uniref:nitrilase and fragile histidine triad fusion protein NitFhit n=1 Tax=Diorhabda carinulata TaxID=1163345 RepID=UPI0025A1B020|nr:nitrilase and fragile histidine triad fusion protein NitFhit [Diorhabda carinulata]